MGIFTRRSKAEPVLAVTEIKGTIARIGVVGNNEFMVFYGFILVGDETRYETSSFSIRDTTGLALALPGDEVSFLVGDDRPNWACGDFVNHSMDDAAAATSTDAA